MAFWKVNHGPKTEDRILFTEDDWQSLLDKKLIVVYAEIGIQPEDYFYLTHGNKSNGGQGIQLLGKIVGEPENCTISKWNGWQQCSYEVVKKTVSINKIYRDNYVKGWTPNFQSTIFKVPENEEPDFEKYILRPFFNMKIDPTTHKPIDVDATNTPSIIAPPPKLFSLNQILYGVPGTGKTFHTAAYAVAICTKCSSRQERIQSALRRWQN